MFHQTLVLGYMGKDPEVRYLPSGNAVVEFSVATTEKWKDKNSGDQREHTEWYNCRAFGKLAEIIGEYRKKGDLVLCEGKLRTDQWEDEGGTKHYRTKLNVQNMRGMPKSGGRSQDGGQRQGQERAPAQGDMGEDFDDDIPF